MASIYYGDMEGSIYTEEGKERLWKEENIIYINGVHAFKIIPRKNSSPLIELWHEDDEQLSSDETVHFDAGWLESLRDLIDTTIKKIESE